MKDKGADNVYSKWGGCGVCGVGIFFLWCALCAQRSLSFFFFIYAPCMLSSARLHCPSTREGEVGGWDEGMGVGRGKGKGGEGWPIFGDVIVSRRSSFLSSFVPILCFSHLFFEEASACHEISHTTPLEMCEENTPDRSRGRGGGTWEGEGGKGGHGYLYL